MKFCVILLVSLVAVSAIAENYQVQGSVTMSRNYGPANTYTGYWYDIDPTSTALVSAGTTKSGNATITPSVKTVPYGLVYGYNNANNAAGSFVPVRWWKAVPTTPPGQVSPQGGYLPDGTPIDDNGLEVDPGTGLPLPGQQAKAGIELENPWEDRFGYFEVDFHDAETGEYLGTKEYAVGPGETIKPYESRERPFIATPYLMAEGTRNAYGAPIHSSGGTSGGSSAPPVTSAPPQGTVTPTTQPPAVANPTTNPETKQAIDRLGQIMANLNDDVKAIGGETNRRLVEIRNSVDGVKGAVNGVKDAVNNIDIPGGGGGGGITQEQVKDAVGEALGNGTGEGGPPEGMDGMLGDKEAIENSIEGIRNGLTGLKGSAEGFVGALGLDRSFGTTSWSYTVSLGPFGTHVVNVEQYGWILDLIRNTIFGCICMHYLGLFFQRLRGALVG